MSVEDGNDQVKVDEQRIIDGLFNKLAPMVQTQSRQDSPVPTQEQRSAIVDIYSRLKAQGHDDKFIAAQVGTAAAIDKEVDAKINQRVGEIVLQNRDNATTALVNRLIREAAKDEPKLSKLSPQLWKTVTEKFNTDPGRKAEYDRGIVNEEAIEKLFDEAVEEVGKDFDLFKGDRPRNAALPGKSGQSTAAAQADKGSQPVDAEDVLNEHQLEWYNTRVSNLQRWGDRDSQTGAVKKLTRQEAEKKAFEQAKVMPKPVLKPVKR